ncbi:XdhC family protein [Embleya sp. NPDC050493]|uniref:XdhC family protein n=1 Tax=Embleya sp. NPDC050493 TaxID=3363989 RepID=UPI0037A786E3
MHTRPRSAHPGQSSASCIHRSVRSAGPTTEPYAGPAGSARWPALCRVRQRLGNTRQFAPARFGAAMVDSFDHTAVGGGLSGGCVEWTACELARMVVEIGNTRTPRRTE